MVEHQRLIACQTTRLLHSWGYEILYCGNDGQRLLREVAHRPPDLVMTGIHLQGPMNGIEMLSRLWIRWQIPVVVLSGLAVEDLPKAWQRRPGLFFLAKPFLPSQLHLIINSALDYGRLPAVGPGQASPKLPPLP